MRFLDRAVDRRGDARGDSAGSGVPATRPYHHDHREGGGAGEQRAPCTDKSQSELAAQGRWIQAFRLTDAAMAERAECVMLNKGPFVLDAVAILDDVLGRMEAHQSKKTSRLRALHSW
jgi:hypothetical protein